MKKAKAKGILGSNKQRLVFVALSIFLVLSIGLLQSNQNLFDLNQFMPNKTAAPTEKSSESKTPDISISELINSTPAEPGLLGLKQHFLQIDKASEANQPIDMPFTLGPTTNEENAQLVRSRFQEKLKFFQSLGLKSLDMHWVIASEKDHDWWLEFRKNQFAGYPVELWDTYKNMLGHCTLDPDIFCGAGNGVNDGFYQDNVIGTEFTDRGLDHVTRHEATHFYQSSVGFIDTCWFVEGQATFFETYLEPTARTREQVINRLISSNTKVALSTEKELVNKLNRNSICDSDPDVRYDLGMLVFEYLYQEYSVQTIHDLLVETNATSWASATNDILGVSSTDLNAGIAKYLFAQLN